MRVHSSSNSSTAIQVVACFPVRRGSRRPPLQHSSCACGHRWSLSSWIRVWVQLWEPWFGCRQSADVPCSTTLEDSMYVFHSQRVTCIFPVSLLLPPESVSDVHFSIGLTKDATYSTLASRRVCASPRSSPILSMSARNLHRDWPDGRRVSRANSCGVVCAFPGVPSRPVQFGSKKCLSCDLRTYKDFQRNHLAESVHLGSVPCFVLVHVSLPYRELQLSLLHGPGGLMVRDAIVRQCALNATHGAVLSDQLEPRHETAHLHVHDEALRGSNRGGAQMQLQPSLHVLDFGPSELQVREVPFGPHLVHVLKNVQACRSGPRTKLCRGPPMCAKIPCHP